MTLTEMLARRLLGVVVAALCCGCSALPGIRVRSSALPEPAGDVAYGYVVFDHQPDPGADRADFRVCNSLFRYLYPKEGATHDREATTYWPAARQLPPYPELCGELLAGYDRAFADTIREQTRPASDPWQVFLIAQDAPFGARARSRVCLDLTGTLSSMSDADLRTGLAKWALLMSGGPDAWHPHGFAAFVNQVLTWWLPRGNVHLDCK